MSDINMPGCDGYHLLRMVRSRTFQEGGATPAIALTGKTTTEDQTRAFLAGYQLHLAKPLRVIELLVAIRNLVEIQPARRATVDPVRTLLLPTGTTSRTLAGIPAAGPRGMPNAPSINVVDLLQSQHAEVDQLFTELEAGTSDRAETFRELANKLAAHATVEEKLFYPGVMRPETSELLHESVEEHLAIKRVLADMLDLDPVADQDEFDAKLSVLKEQVSHHAHEEEEAKLFPKVRKAMDAEELAGLGNEVLALFETLMAGEPRRNVPRETQEAAPLPAES